MTTQHFSTMVCDGPMCDKVVHVGPSVRAPNHWYSLGWYGGADSDEDGLRNYKDLDFCSLTCLEEWCKAQSFKSA